MMDVETAIGVGLLVYGVVFVVVPIIIGLVAWLALRAASRSARPRENRWAAWSLILGLAFLLPFCIGCAASPFAIWAGIKAYRMGGSRRMAIGGIVLGTVGTLCGVAFLLYYVFSLVTGMT